MSESAAARLSRLLALVPWLMSHDGVTLAECAAHFGVSDEQLQQDLELLIVCGRPGYGPDQLVDIQFWDDDFEIRLDERIHVVDPQDLGQPLRLTHEEALTLLVALHLLAQVPGVDGREAIVSAAVRLESATRAHDAARAIAVQTGVADDVRVAVDEAVATNRSLRLRYASSTKDEVTERTVDPQRLLTVDGVAYLEGYCHTAEAMRTFRLDRVLTASVGEPVGETPAVGSDGERPAPVTAVLDVEPGARWIADVHGGEVREEHPDGRATVALPLLSAEWGVRLVLSLRGQAVVREPADLRAAVAAAADAARASYP